MRSQDGVHCEANSLSLRSGERVSERGAWEIRDRFQATFSKLSPPRPSPRSFLAGRGRRRSAACSPCLCRLSSGLLCNDLFTNALAYAPAHSLFSVPPNQTKPLIMKNLERLKELAAEVPRLAAKLRADDVHCLALGESLRRSIAETA